IFLFKFFKISLFVAFLARSATRGTVPIQPSVWSCHSTHSYAKNVIDQKQKPQQKALDRGPFASQLDYKARLQIHAPRLEFPLSGIVCTIGPASNNPETLLKLISAGMRVVRLNFSHGSHDFHCQTILAARKAVECYAKQTGVLKSVAIALDTKGPEIRTGQISGGDAAEIQLSRGDQLRLTTKREYETKCSKEILYVDYDKLPKLVAPESRVYIDDGLISLLVKDIKDSEILCEVQNPGKLGSRKGVNLPGVKIDLPAITEKDKLDLKFGAEQNVDMVFASFVRDADAIHEIRDVLGPNGKHVMVISKIENQQGLDNLDEIIEASDGVMVARGDLGIEIPAEDVVLAQKSIIAKCNMLGKPVICATHMLQSMTNRPRPTRAEASDVANAVFDGADCVMLSAETAKGNFPVESVQCMSNICSKIESVLWYDRIQSDVKSIVKTSSTDQLSAVTSGITEAASLSDAKAIVIASPCSLVPQMVSQFRPRCPVIMLTGDPRQARQSVIYRGVYPLIVEEMAWGCTDFRRILQSGVEQMAQMKFVKFGDPLRIVIVDAMRARNISFRILSIHRRSEEEKLKEITDAQVRYKQQAEEKKKMIEKNRTMSDTTKTPEQIEKCKKMAEMRKRKKAAKKCKEIQMKSEGKSGGCSQKGSGSGSGGKKSDKKGGKGNKAGSGGGGKKGDCNDGKKKEQEAKCKKLAEEKKKKEQEAKCKKQAEEKKKKEQEAKCKKEAEEKKKKEQEAKCKKQAEEKKKKEQEAKCKKLAEEKKKKEQEAKCKKLAEEKKKKEQEAKAKKQAEEKKKKEQEAKCKKQAEEKKKKEQEAKCKKLAEEKKKKEQEAKCKKEAEEKKKKDQEAKCKKEAEEKKKKEQEAKCKKLAEEKKKKEQEAKCKKEAEEKKKKEQEAKAKKQAEEKKKKEQEAKCKKLAEEKKKKEEEAKCKKLAEEKKKKEQAAKAKKQAEEKKKKEEEAMCKKLAEEKKKEEEAAKCKKLADEAKKQEEAKAVEQCRKAAEEKKQQEECKKLAAEEKRKMIRQKCKEIIEQQKKKKKEEAAKCRKAAEAEKRKAETAKCKKMAEEKKQKECAEKFKRAVGKNGKGKNGKGKNGKGKNGKGKNGKGKNKSKNGKNKGGKCK
ncbi:axoneme-associated protein mst101(2), partial [Drosophila busckii]|uniref:axoneme-associated protein mst101(2) n=1 Tax=Drosophila busckii TaxID=30019 RepID=UPI001432A0BA